MKQKLKEWFFSRPSSYWYCWDKAIPSTENTGINNFTDLNANVLSTLLIILLQELTDRCCHH